MPNEAVSIPQSQTLDRGLRILEYLAASGAAASLVDITEATGLHRSIAYRLLRTLEDHRLVGRNPAGHYELGLGVATLARRLRTELQLAAVPELDALVRDLGMTAFLVVRDRDEAVTVLSTEPPDTAAHVVYRPGTRHPVNRGAPGLALLMPDAPSATDRAELRQARQRGWAISHGEVIAGLRSVAAPVRNSDGGAHGALAVVFVDDTVDTDHIGHLVATAAATVTADLRGPPRTSAELRRRSVSGVGQCRTGVLIGG